jgi:hypothetical protein
VLRKAMTPLALVIRSVTSASVRVNRATASPMIVNSRSNLVA